MCSGPKWKREIVPDHKFDFIDTREFTDNGFFMRLKYLWLYIIVLKSFLVYVSDIFTAITMLSTDSWSNQIFNQCAELKEKDTDCIAIPFETGKWLFVGCIIFSFLLLAYESRKAKKIIASRDISYAFTNVMANNYYSLRSYDHFCFFDHISNSTKTSDDFAFFVFFVFKSWKRVLLADGPRQTINALTLYAVYLAHTEDRDKETNEIRPWYDVGKYFPDNNELSTSALTVTTFFTVVVFAGSLLLLLVAGICYVPLLIHIRGNLKEYCCHKVDKRISAVIKRRQKQRLADAAKLAQKEAAGDYSHLKNKKGEMIAKPLPQPTLPNLSVDDDFDDSSSMRTRGPPGSTYTQDQYYYNSDKGGYPPPMPAYNPYSAHQGPGSLAHYNPSQPSVGGHEESLYNYPQGYMYEDDNNSVANLTAGAAPFAHQHQHLAPMDRPGTTPPLNNPYSPGPNASFDPHDVYQGRDVATPDPTRQRSPTYDDGRQGYTNQYHQDAGYAQQSYGQHHQDQTYQHQGYRPSDAVSYSQQQHGYDQYGAHHGHGDAYSIHDHQPAGRRVHDPGYGGAGTGGTGGYAM